MICVGFDREGGRERFGRIGKTVYTPNVFTKFAFFQSFSLFSLHALGSSYSDHPTRLEGTNSGSMPTVSSAEDKAAEISQLSQPKSFNCKVYLSALIHLSEGNLPLRGKVNNTVALMSPQWPLSGNL